MSSELKKHVIDSYMSNLCAKLMRPLRNFKSSYVHGKDSNFREASFACFYMIRELKGIYMHFCIQEKVIHEFNWHLETLLLNIYIYLGQNGYFRKVNFIYFQSTNSI